MLKMLNRNIDTKAQKLKMWFIVKDSLGLVKVLAKAIELLTSRGRCSLTFLLSLP